MMCTEYLVIRNNMHNRGRRMEEEAEVMQGGENCVMRFIISTFLQV
jgi:hypothetical protein